MSKKNMELSFDDSGKFIRMANFNEKNTHGSWLYASCNIDKVTPEEGIKNIKNKFNYLLTHYKILRIILKKEENKLNWYYAENKNLNPEKLISKVEPPNNNQPIIYPTEPLPLWRITLCNLNNKTNIRIDINHAITDGRVIFDYLELFSCIANNESLPKKFIEGQNQIPILPLDINNIFEKEIFDTCKIPDSWKKAILFKLNPPIELPSYSICDYWEFEYEPIEKFCKKYNFTIQGILNATQTRAYWNYHNGKLDNMEFGIYIPIDTRRLKYSTKEYKNRLLGNHISNILIFVNKKDSILEQIKHCQEEMIKSYNSFEGDHSFITMNNLMNINI